MALTNTERQRRYRQARQKADGPLEDRLDITIDFTARDALRRIATHNHTTQKAALEQILNQALDDLIHSLDDQALNDFWDRQ